MATKYPPGTQQRLEICYMSNNELELIGIIRESEDPKAVAEYFFSLFSNYLQTHGPSQEKTSAELQESA